MTSADVVADGQLFRLGLVGEDVIPDPKRGCWRWSARLPDKLIGHAKVEEAYKYFSLTGAQPLREDSRRFPFAGARQLPRPTAATADDLAGHFRRAPRKQVATLLATLVELGHARATGDGRFVAAG